MLNLALWGCTAKQWREANPKYAEQGLNIRDMASINELVVLANLESMNSELNKQGLDKIARYAQLRNMAQEQLKRLNLKETDKNFRAIELRDKKLMK